EPVEGAEHAAEVTDRGLIRVGRVNVRTARVCVWVVREAGAGERLEPVAAMLLRGPAGVRVVVAVHASHLAEEGDRPDPDALLAGAREWQELAEQELVPSVPGSREAGVRGEHEAAIDARRLEPAAHALRREPAHPVGLVPDRPDDHAR